MIKIDDYIKSKNIYIQHNFIKENFNSLLKKLQSHKLKATYQPNHIFYGNRFQAYPCYETDLNNELNEYFKKKIQKLFKSKLKNFKSIYRITLLEEFKKSACYGEYNFIHQDVDDNTKIEKIGGLLYLEQSVDSGTGFYYNKWDKKPDIKIGSFPNRLILYSGTIPHSALHDLNNDKRHILIFFFEL